LTAAQRDEPPGRTKAAAAAGLRNPIDENPTVSGISKAPDAAEARGRLEAGEQEQQQHKGSGAMAAATLQRGGMITNPVTDIAVQQRTDATV
jgi:hypothetical protein